MKKGTIKLVLITILLLAVIVIGANYEVILKEYMGISLTREEDSDQGNIDLLGSGSTETVNTSGDDKSSVRHLRDKRLLYDDNNDVTTMYLTVRTGNSADGTDHTWEEVNTYSAYYYNERGIDRYKVEGLLQVGDENGIKPGNLGYGRVTPNATVQIRGQTSSAYVQKNYKIELKDDMGSWNGQTTIALNKHMADGLRFRNKMCFSLLSEIDQLMSLRTHFVHLYVNDLTDGDDSGFEDYGLYTQVEQLNKTALKIHGLDKYGHLYKVNEFEFYRYEDKLKLTSDPTFDRRAIESVLEIKGDEDNRKLLKMIEKVNDYSTPIDEIIDEYFDRENITYWLAFNILTGNIDTQNRNCYLYSSKNSERWYFLPWDYDASFNYDELLLEDRVDYGGWERGVSNYWGNVLFQRCLKSENFRKELDSAVLDLKEYLSKERLLSEVKKYREVVEPYVFREPDVFNESLTPEEYDFVAGKLPDLVDFYYDNYVETLQFPMPFYAQEPIPEREKFMYYWDQSFDFQQDDITYTFSVSRDYNFTEVIDSYKGQVAKYEGKVLEPGQYFLKVEATDSEGHTTPAFDYYVIEETSSKVYGVVCFYVFEDGSVVRLEQLEGEF